MKTSPQFVTLLSEMIDKKHKRFLSSYISEKKSVKKEADDTEKNAFKGSDAEGSKEDDGELNDSFSVDSLLEGVDFESGGSDQENTDASDTIKAKGKPVSESDKENDFWAMNEESEEEEDDTKTERKRRSEGRKKNEACDEEGEQVEEESEEEEEDDTKTERKRRSEGRKKKNEADETDDAELADFLDEELDDIMKEAGLMDDEEGEQVEEESEEEEEDDTKTERKRKK